MPTWAKFPSAPLLRTPSHFPPDRLQRASSPSPLPRERLGPRAGPERWGGWERLCRAGLGPLGQLTAINKKTIVDRPVPEACGHRHSHIQAPVACVPAPGAARPACNEIRATGARLPLQRGLALAVRPGPVGVFWLLFVLFCFVLFSGFPSSSGALAWVTLEGFSSPGWENSPHPAKQYQDRGASGARPSLA